MKRICYCIAILLCVCFTGCKTRQTLISEGGATGEKGNKTYPTLAADWSNRTDPSLPSGPGGAFDLWADENGTIMFENVKAKDGKVEVFLRHRWDLEDGTVPGEVNITAVVTVNNTVCDFELGDQKSENGVLSVTRALNDVLTEALTVRGCNLVAGENELSVHMAVYFPQIGWTLVNSISRTFQSECTQEQSTEYTYEFAELQNGVVVTSDGKSEREIAAELQKSGNFVYDKISFDESRRCLTIARDGELAFEFVNCGFASEKKAPERDAIVLVLENGELLPAWDGESLLRLSLSEQDLSVKLPISMAKEQGKYALLNFVFFDLEDDRRTVGAESLFLFQ